MRKKQQNTRGGGGGGIQPSWEEEICPKVFY